MRLSPHKRTAMSAVAGHPHPLTQEQCYERIYYGLVSVNYCYAVMFHDRDQLLTV